MLDNDICKIYFDIEFIKLDTYLNTSDNIKLYL